MAIFKPYKIQSSQLEDLPVVEGQFIATTDTQKLYLDKNSADRIELCDTDLTGYVKNTDYASSNTGGVIKTASSKATSVSSGVLQADTKTYSDYTSGGNDMFIGKGTLENVLTGKGYTTNTGTITGVSVNGTSVATSGVANITSIPASTLTGAIPSAVTATTQSQGDGSTKVATTAYVDTAISNLPDPMVFKGSLGTGGTITALPVDGSANVGDTYKVITAGTYASKAADVGDTFICLTKTSSANTWELIPSGDEPAGTVTSITLSATSPISIDSSAAITTSGSRTISHATSGVTAGTYTSVTVNDTGHVTAGTSPTTLAGYGITDASISSQTITLGSNTVTVPTKTSDLTNDSNFITGMFIAAYGKTTYADVLAAYKSNKVVYCRASSSSNPASGNQLRMAFLAYVNSETDPTEFEFQYYRSVATHSDSQQGDQVYIYKLKSASGWENSVRNAFTKVAKGTALTSSYSNGVITIGHGTSGVTAGTYKSVTVDAQGHVTAGTNPTTISGYGITDAKIDSGVITLGSNTITPLTSSSTLDATKLSGTIPSGCYTDTKNTAGSTNTSDTLYLIGAKTQAANPQTYSNNALYFSNGLHSQATAGQGGIMVTINQSSSGITLEYDNGYSDHLFTMDSTGISITGIKTPTSDTMAANKKYVDDNLPTIDTSITSGSTSTGVPTTAAVATYVDNHTVTVENASSTVAGVLKVRLDDNTHTLYITNNGQDA